MLSYLQQYVIYILAGVLVIGAIAIGTQTVRLNMAQKDLLACQKSLEAEQAINLANKGTLSQLKADADRLQSRLADAQEAIIISEKKHSEYIKKLISSIPVPTSGKCEDMVDWAKKMAIGGKK